MLRYIIFFSTLLMMAVTVRAQCEKPVIGGNRIMTEGSQQETFSEGSTVKFNCSTGYVPERRGASSSITCMGTQWSELELQCKKMSCGNPGEISNGKYIYQPTNALFFGAVITAECYKGYQLVANPIRTCRENGWDGSLPVCEAVKCQTPPDVKYGTFEPVKEFYSYNELVTYSCKRGLNLIGSSMLACSDEGHFQPDPPQCLLVTCEKPEILNAVRIEGKSPPYKYRQFVRYRCNKGYKMEGSDLMICTEKGWDPPPPQCTAVKCQTPPAVTDGTFEPVKEFYSYEEGVTYSCKRGLNLIGSSILTCSDEGHFQPDPPQCRQKSCGNPGEITNGKYKYQPTDAVLFGAVVTAVCNKGYQLVGYGIRNCRENGWDGRHPECEVLKCQMPPDVTDGTFEPDKEHYAYEEVVTYSCKRGLNLIGSSRLTCSDEGHFQPDPPQCRLVTCEKPEILNAVRIEGKSPPYKYREFVRYRCNEGYKMEGSDQMICTEKGWDPPPPQCTVITCVNPPNITNGHFTPKKEFYEYEQKVTYSCDEGFKLKGTSSISCTLQETFEPLLSQCLAVTCDPPSIDHGVVNVSLPSYKYNDQVHISCKEGFKIDGSNILTCKNQGWSPPLPRCIEMTCFAPEIPNAFIIGEKASSYKYKSSIRVQCNKGYKMEGSGFLTCKENGWDSPLPKCTIVTCSPPPRLINHGKVNQLKQLYEYGQKVTYSCDAGFQLDGDQTRSCTEYGKFQDPPRCLDATCDEPHIINGFIIGDELKMYLYKSSVQVKCNRLYKMEGSDILTCEENRWNPPSPKCHFNHLVWIFPVIAVILAPILVNCFVRCCRKYRKPSEYKDSPKPENCTLVTMHPRVPPTEETLKKNSY